MYSVQTFLDQLTALTKSKTIKLAMKLTWGHKLIFVFILFGTMMTYMVYRSFGTRVDLVSREYYNDELAYQELIDGAQTVSDKGAALKLTFRGRVVTVQQPDSSVTRPTEGTAWFYCVSDSDKDQKISLTDSSRGTGALAEVLLKEGRYIAKLRWSTADGDFYSEEKFNVQ
jgi:hypothetical protein